MSTRRREVFVEFPNFGFGPASTTLTMVQHAPSDIEWHVVSTGAAAAFARAQLPGAVVHDIDTFDPSQWPRFVEVAPPGSLVISNTNLDFAGWAARAGYEVGIVDTLDWMWAQAPAGIELARFHLVQAFLATAESRIAAPRREVVGPIVDRNLWRPRPKDPGLAVVGFGGMAVPGQDGLVADYTRWLLAQTLPALIDVADTVVVAGGRIDLPALLPDTYARDARVQVVVASPRPAYADLCTRAAHLVLAPGLATVYECAAAGVTPLLQPGFNMSMVLQAHRLAMLGHPYVASWPWMADVQPRLAGMAEADGVRAVADHMRQTIGSGDGALDDAIRRYIKEAEPITAWQLPELAKHPDGPTRLAEHLGQWLDGAP